MKLKSESEVFQSCPTRIDPMDLSLPGSSVHGILQASVLEWAAIAFSVLNPSHFLKAPSVTASHWRLGLHINGGMGHQRHKHSLPSNAGAPFLGRPGGSPSHVSPGPGSCGAGFQSCLCCQMAVCPRGELLNLCELLLHLKKGALKFLFYRIIAD